MTETAKQRRIRKARQKAVKKQNLKQAKQKLKDERELTLHEAHQRTAFCRRHCEGRVLRAFSRFVRDTTIADEENNLIMAELAAEAVTRPTEYDHVIEQTDFAEDLDDYFGDDDDTNDSVIDLRSSELIGSDDRYLFHEVAIG